MVIILMPELRCEPCNKIFDSEEALQQHNSAKHTVQEKPKRKINKNKITGIVVILLIAGGIAYTQMNKPSYTPALPDGDNIKGSLNGTIEMVEFSDFQCPACGAAYPEVKKIMAQYGDTVKFVYKHFPLTNIHPLAFKAAEASECAGDQGKFWEYHDKLFENQKKMELRDLNGYAIEIGLDTEKFDRCIGSGVMGSRVSKDQSEGLSKSVGATPTFFINGQKNEGVINLEKFRQSTGL